MEKLHQFTTCLNFQTASERELVREYDREMKKSRQHSLGQKLITVFMLAFRLKNQVDGEVTIARQKYLITVKPI